MRVKYEYGKEFKTIRAILALDYRYYHDSTLIEPHVFRWRHIRVTGSTKEGALREMENEIVNFLESSE